MNTPSFSMRLPTDLREKLEERAHAEGRSLSNYLERLIRASLDVKPPRRTIAPRTRKHGQNSAR